MISIYYYFISKVMKVSINPYFPHPQADGISPGDIRGRFLDWSVGQRTLEDSPSV